MNQAMITFVSELLESTDKTCSSLPGKGEVTLGTIAVAGVTGGATSVFEEKLRSNL